MKILLTGGTGQLGQEIIKSKPIGVEIFNPSRIQLDLSDYNSCIKIARDYKPDWIINCGAYTQVDAAEKNIQLSQEINAYAPEAFAEATNEISTKLLHISTDFVFDGEQNFPYKTSQKTNPINQYGYSKALGEELIKKKTKNEDNFKILRTSWVVSPNSKNFVLTMLKLHEQKDTLNVVSDQIGAPTSAKHLAETCWTIVNFRSNSKLPNILHWSDAGVASWYDLAVAIGEIGIELGILNKKAYVNPIKTINYPTPAKRPKYSLLDSQKTCEILDVYPNHWRMNLLEIMIEYSKIKRNELI